MLTIFRRISVAAASLLLVFSGARSLAQSLSLDGIAHVAFRVSDVAATRAFYEKLGFEQAFAREQEGVISQAFIKINDLQFIELYPHSRPDQPLGFMHLCFLSSDLNNLHAAYLQQGLTPTAVRKAGAGNQLFTLEGPEHQNIEYTQYMPGSLHSNDTGKHLGAHRISEQLVGVGLAMRDPGAAKAFYLQKLGFKQLKSGAGTILGLPGSSGLVVEIIPTAADTRAPIFFSVTNVKRAAAELKDSGFTVTPGRDSVSIADPDGNVLVFTTAKALR